MASSTHQRTAGIIKNYLLPAFRDKCLRDLTSMARQTYRKAMIEKRYHRGDWSVPKSEASNATVEVSGSVNRQTCQTQGLDCSCQGRGLPSEPIGCLTTHNQMT